MIVNSLCMKDNTIHFIFGFYFLGKKIQGTRQSFSFIIFSPKYSKCLILAFIVQCFATVCWNFLFYEFVVRMHNQLTTLIKIILIILMHVLSCVYRIQKEENNYINAQEKNYFVGKSFVYRGVYLTYSIFMFYSKP